VYNDRYTPFENLIILEIFFKGVSLLGTDPSAQNFNYDLVLIFFEKKS